METVLGSSNDNEKEHQAYYASEVFLRETMEIAENNGWLQYQTWALRARIEMQVNAVHKAKDAAAQLAEPKRLMDSIDRLSKFANFEMRSAMFDFGPVPLVREISKTWEAIGAFSRELHAFSREYPRFAEDIENTLVSNHRAAMLSDFSKWCPGAPSLDPRTIYEHSVGAIALSGGGIRSASYCLGVVGALASESALGKMHFISGVSGGGYVASWLTTWAYRHKNGIAGVQSEIAHGGASCAPIQWIRRYTSYLCPKPGILATDTWSLLVSYIRNWLPVLFLVLTITTLILLSPRLVAIGVEKIGKSPNSDVSYYALVFSCLALLTFLSLMRYLTLFNKKSDDDSRSRAIPAITAAGAPTIAIALTITFPSASKYFGDDTSSVLPDTYFSYLFSDAPAKMLLWWILLYGVAIGIACFGPLVHRLLANFTVGGSGGPKIATYKRRMGLLRMVGLAIIGGFAATLVSSALMPIVVHATIYQQCVLIPAAVVLIFGSAEIAIVVFMERWQNDVDRAWASRLGGWNLGAVMVWIFICAISLGSPYVTKILGTGLVLSFSALLLLLIIGYVRIKSSSDTLIAAAAISGTILFSFAGAALEPLLKAVQEIFSSPGRAIFVCALVTLFVALSTDVNRFSLHSIYKEGLVRTFLGASRLSSKNMSIKPPLADPAEPEGPQYKKRKPDVATDIDPNDDPRLSWLTPRKERNFPLLLLNAAVNGRSATDDEGRFPRQWPFTFSPMFSGSPASGIGYAPTKSFFTNSKSARGLSLGTAMAVSGAAVSPASGKITHPIRGFLLSILNARLGLWIGNPR